MAENQIEIGMRRGVERRLEFIEYRLYWEGGVNRSDIIEKFGVSQPQASNDLTQYQRLAPDNIRYDTSAKQYQPTPEFNPVYHKPNASHYLVELKSVASDVVTPAELWSGVLPEADVMPIPGRLINPEILRPLLKVIRAGKSVYVQYHSMSDESPDPTWRWITPHAFGFDGLRWHVRAYCHDGKHFRDFVLSRITEIGKIDAARIKPSADKDWHSFFDVMLKPNPKLGQGKMRTVELEYDMSEGKLILSVRHALLYYLNMRLRLDIGEEHDKPQETPIVVANRDDFQKAISEANGFVLQF
jgi:predicted DNA-binding transcriptional regulator YafY